MVTIDIGTNEKGQRFDRFLRKLLPKAPLSLIYRIVRKDAKVSGKRVKKDYMLEEGDVVSLYISGEKFEALKKENEHKRARKTFSVAYEDEHILIAAKPVGLLTHGDSKEKSEHLTNQVKTYLDDKGGGKVSEDKTFSVAPVNRLDRNTAGLVVFAKDYETLKVFTGLIRERVSIKKKYLAVAAGEINEDRELIGAIRKDEKKNKSELDAPAGSDGSCSGKTDDLAGNGKGNAKEVASFVHPLKKGRFPKLNGSPAFTFCEIELVTGRTHQIRAQMSAEGHALIGDPKYGDPEINSLFREEYGLTSQFLIAYKLEFSDMPEEFSYLDGKVVICKLNDKFEKIKNELQ